MGFDYEYCHAESGMGFVYILIMNIFNGKFDRGDG